MLVNVQFPLWATGRRKNATARVRVIQGSGKLSINDRTIDEFFGGHGACKWYVGRPLGVAKNSNQFDIFVDVHGGGVAGQAEAISHGLARAFSQMDNAVRIAMRKEGLLTRDSRMVERKKPGRPKARKRFQYSKR